MLASLAFVPEIDVIDSFIILMHQFPEGAIEIAKYFEKTYIGKVLPDLTRRVVPNKNLESSHESQQPSSQDK